MKNDSRAAFRSNSKRKTKMALYQNRLFRKLIQEFTMNEIAPYDAQMDATGTFDREIIDKLFRHGFIGCSFSREYGGAGLDKIYELYMLEEIAFGSASVALTVDATFLGMNCINKFGNETQKSKYLTKAIAGKSLTAFGLTEPSVGSDVAALHTVAKNVGGGYLINGQKAWITNYSVADVIVVFAKTAPELDVKGISAFIVDKDTKGLYMGDEEDKMGMRGSNTGSLLFQDMWIPKEQLLGEEGMGFKMAMATLDAARLHISAMGIGLMRHALTESRTYANARKAFGKNIGAFQGIQFLLADMEIRLYAARCMIEDAAKRAVKAEDYTEQAAMLKAFVSDATMKTTNEAIQIFGGNGYSKEYHVERLLRDAKLLDIGEGTAQVLRMIIGRNSLKRGGR